MNAEIAPLVLMPLGLAIVGGMLHVNSGYVHMGTTPGNVLLAFAVE